MARAAVDRDEFRQSAHRAVLVLFASVSETLGWATAALLDQDVDLAERVVADGRDVEDRCRRLTSGIRDRLAAGRLSGGELEDLIAILQMVPDLERSVGLTDQIARGARLGLGGSISPRCRGLIQSMCDTGISVWQLAGRAFAEGRTQYCDEATEADDRLDRLSAWLLAECVLRGLEPAVAAELALIARYYERVGDHAVNLARRSTVARGIQAPRRARSVAAARRVVPH